MNSLNTFVRASLWITAPFNLVAGFIFAFPASWLGQLISFPADVHPFFAYFSGAMVALFGLMYIWLARQPEIVKPILFFGASGKTLAAIIAIGLFASQQLSGTTAFLMAVSPPAINPITTS